MGSCTSGNAKSPGKKPTAEMKLFVKTYTWVRDVSGLFDYECLSPILKDIKVSGAGKLYRVENDVVFVSGNSPVPAAGSNVQLLANVEVAQGNYFVAGVDDPNYEKSLGQTLRRLKGSASSSKQLGLRLSEDAVFKLGKVRYCVKELYREPETAQKAAHSFQTDEDPKHHHSYSGEEEKREASSHSISINIEEDKQKPLSPPAPLPAVVLTNKDDVPLCRICQGEDNTPENPLISPCKCSGSIKFVHIQCMQEWYKSKLFARVVQNTSSYVIKGLECELCKQKFSMRLEHNGKPVDLLNVCRPKTGAYIVLESFGEPTVTHIHISAMENKQSIRLGRARDSDIKVNDNTVSRCHATIKFLGNEYYLNDTGSKFGTQVIVKGKLQLDPEVPLWVQAGKTVMSFGLVDDAREENSSCGGGCFPQKKVKSEKTSPPAMSL